MCGTVRHASAMLRAIVRRIPRNGTRRSPVTSSDAVSVAGAVGRPARRGARTSFAVTRPPGPLPDTASRSTPSSRASLRTGGAACAGL